MHTQFVRLSVRTKEKSAKVLLFFESTKFVKQILQILLQNKSNKANWTNWTPDARGWTPGGAEGLEGRTIRRNRKGRCEVEGGGCNKKDGLQKQTVFWV